MFRKIHSNRDPKATLYSELRKEFGPYFQKANDRTFKTILAYPKPAFWGMLFLLLISAILSFTIFRKHPTTHSAKVRATDAKTRKPVLDDGFERILSTGAALKRTLHLRDKVEVLLSKAKLDHADSLELEKTLDSLGQLQHQINH